MRLARGAGALAHPRRLELKHLSLRRNGLDPRVSIAVVYVAASFMSIMDTTIVNVALATLSKKFHVATGSIDAVVVGYLISLAVVIPASGWIGDRFGTKRVFLLALSIFT